MKNDISRAQLNAFIDGELDLAEKDEIFCALKANPELAHQLCELRAVKDMVRHAYAQPPQAGNMHSARRFTAAHYLAAGLVLAVGGALGWFGREWSVSAQPAFLAHTAPSDIRPVSLVGVTPDAGKIILHLDSADPIKLRTLVEQAEYLLQTRAASGQPVQVEIISNNNGLSLLRADVTPYAERIDRLARQHTNISFVACGQTVRRLTREGIKVQLLPQTRVAPTAIGEIVDRLQQGWTYVKV